MPEIQLKHVVSCSSEDRNNPAENLLKAEGTHKWRTAVAAEKTASVVIQFEKSSQIHSVDIGNEGSAFVEVLVGKSTSTADTDFQVLLVSSSFMSPADSRNNTNRNAVRIFGPDKLSKTVANGKWDRVKIVCTQPFNKTNPFGLSFIKFHSPPDASKPGQKEGMKKLGAFFVKKEEDEDDIQTGALFASRGKKEEAAATPPPTGAAAVRAASRLAEESRAASSRSPAGRGRNSDSPSNAAAAVGSPKASPATSKAAASPSKGRKKHAVSDEDGDTEEDEPAPRRTSLKRQSTSVSSVASSRSADAPPPLKKTRTEPPKPSPAKEFTRLMEKVVFVLSGFQNPYRGELREKALEMGAQYKPDWGKGCTHLVCAFPNTPKYNQVNGRGRIVSKQWIIDCHKQKKLLPWRKYRLGDADSPGDSSEEEEEFTRPKKATPQKTLSKKGSASKTPTPSKKKEEPEADIYGGDTDSADDTDEELRRAKVKAAAMQKGKESKSQKEDSTKEDVEAKEKKEVKATEDPTLALFADSTDEDEPSGAAAAMDTDDDGADSGLPDLPDFFADKHFFFYGDFDAKERRLLTRYVAAYDGVLEDYMNDRVKYVVTSAKWDDNFDQALSENPGLVFVKPKWIHACHDKNKLLPHQPYVVVP